MKGIRNYVLLGAAIVTSLLAGCSKPTEVHKNLKIPKRIVLKSPEANIKIEWESIIDEMSVIPLETNNDNLISSITKAVVTDKFIYVLDRNQPTLFIYHKNGKLFNKIVEGSAPDNSRNLNDFTLDNEGNLWILSFQSLEKYSPEGQRLKIYSINLQDEEIKYINPFLIGFSGKSFYLWGGSVGHKGSELRDNPTYAMVQVTRTGEEYKIENKYFPVRRALVETARFAQFRDTLFLTTFQESDIIYSAYHGQIQPEYFVDFGSNSYSEYPDTKDFTKSESALRYEIINNTKRCGGVMAPALTDTHVSFEYEGNGWGSFHKVICDRKTLHVKSGRIVTDENISFQISSEYNNSFVAFAESTAIRRYVAAQKDTTRVPIGIRKNLKVLARITDADNPIILILKLKSF